MKLNVDYRESGEVFNNLIKCGADPQRVTNELGDIVTDQVIIEVKLAADFIGSILNIQSDGRSRLDSQCERMAEQIELGKVCYVLIIGTLEDVEDRQRVRLSESGVYGFMGSAAVRYGVNIIWVYRSIHTGGMYQAMYIANKICNAVAEGKLGKPRFSRRTGGANLPKNVDAIKRAFGLSDGVAMRLAKKFGSLTSVCTASITQLKSIDGIGETRARLIHDTARHGQ